LQTEAVRAVNYNKTKVDTIYSKQRILKMRDLFKFSLAKCIYSLHNCGLPEHFDNHFCKTSSSSQLPYKACREGCGVAGKMTDSISDLSKISYSDSST